MIGNWGQHALVDEVEPDSDFRSSITLVDVPVRDDPSSSPFLTPIQTGLQSVVCGRTVGTVGGASFSCSFSTLNRSRVDLDDIE